MRRHAALSACLICWKIALAQQPDWFNELQQKLAPYSLTKVSQDGTTILKPGTKFTLKNGSMGVAAATPGRIVAATWLNKYADGQLVPQFPYALQNMSERGLAMSIHQGEKVWIASLVRRKADIELSVVTDVYRRTLANRAFADQSHVEGVRFMGEVRFPLPKDTAPDANQIFASMQKVFEPDDASPTGFCSALVKLKSTVLSTIIEDTVLPNGEPPDQNGEEANSEFFHSESISLHGDQAKQIHAVVRGCLPGLEVTKPVTVEQGFYRSTLAGYDAPYDLTLEISSKLEPDGDTFLGIGLNRLQSKSQVRLDDAAIAYVAVAVDTCGWRLQNQDQTNNVNRLLGNRSNWFQDELDTANKHVAEVGRLDFCSDPKERAKFDRLVPTLWPVGAVGRP